MSTKTPEYIDEKVKAARLIIGERLESIRLRQDKQQADVWQAASSSRNTYQRLIKGHGKPSLNSFLAVAEELGVLDAIVAAIPEEQVSPMQALENSGKRKTRVKRSAKIQEEAVLKYQSGKGDTEW